MFRLLFLGLGFVLAVLVLPFGNWLLVLLLCFVILLFFTLFLFNFVINVVPDSVLVLPFGFCLSAPTDGRVGATGVFLPGSTLAAIGAVPVAGLLLLLTAGFAGFLVPGSE